VNERNNGSFPVRSVLHCVDPLRICCRPTACGAESTHKDVESDGQQEWDEEGAERRVQDVARSSERRTFVVRQTRRLVQRRTEVLFVVPAEQRRQTDGDRDGPDKTDVGERSTAGRATVAVPDRVDGGRVAISRYDTQVPD